MVMSTIIFMIYINEQGRVIGDVLQFRFEL